ncbi:sulfite exporter TauE/SafE family protein [Marinospirillum alkaliphilum]|uniref:Probable membrane transporter protein n=1 Tax=Marinospirillum alkaliphilum DSM 21637 TaxID=1122209 RepID=A0A1K1YI14_9GAMM|nr:sulfite exporter TauE/SafE family protein [Marinospirillum alkaliphilum]SFX61045.1 Sulfite exporter TauE/SafE [Marinospirillum alkaliphilum DSM 21637]
MPWFEALLPEQLSHLSALFLILAAGLTSAITASIGVGGGVLLLAVMALMLPPAAIIPVHGMVQLGSNLNRALMTLKDIDWKLLAAFTPGAIFGAWLASLFLVQLPMNLLLLTIAGFILFLTWGPKIPPIGLGRLGTFVAAVVTTFISMFAGATGPLVAAFVKQQHQGDRFRTVANFAAAMSVQHIPKAVVFGAAGFVFRDWLGLMLLMIASGAIGTFLGLRLLARLSNRNFGRIINVILTLLAIRLIWDALTMTN